MRFRRRFRNSREVSQFYPFARAARDDSSYRANSGCPRFPDLCDRKSVERAVASLLSPEMRYLGRRGPHVHNCSSRVVNFIHLCGLLPKRFPKDQYKVLRELGYSDKKFTADPFLSKDKESFRNYLKNMYI